MVLLPNPVNIEHAPTRIIIEVSESRIVQNIEDVIQTFRSYVEERRTLEIPRFRREELDYAIRYTPMEHSAFGIVCFTRAGEDDIEGFIESQISYFAQVGIDFEWKVYDFDQPPDLKQRLLDWGFEKGISRHSWSAIFPDFMRRKSAEVRLRMYVESRI